MLTTCNYRGLTKFDERAYNESVKLTLAEDDGSGTEKERKVLTKYYHIYC